MIAIISNPYLLAGLALYGISMVIWLSVLSKVEIGVAYMFNALAFVIVLTGGYVFFGEAFSWYKFAGIICIMLGLFFISRA